MNTMQTMVLRRMTLEDASIMLRRISRIYMQTRDRDAAISNVHRYLLALNR